MAQSLENYLRDACNLTSAIWAALVDCDKGRWFVDLAYHLPRTRRAALEEYMAQATVRRWMESAQQLEEVAPIMLRGEPRLGPGRLYAFALRDRPEIVLVCAKTLSGKALGVWRLLGNLFPTRAGDDPDDAYLPSVQAELAYDLPRAMDRVLSSLVRGLPLHGAWLAIRRGDVLDIAAQRSSPRLQSSAIPLDSNRLLRRAHRNLSDVSVVQGEPDWQFLPHAVRRSTKYWICLPLIIGRRLIGAVGVWGPDVPPPQAVKVLKNLTRRVSHSVEIIVTFNELTGHLRRLAMLNDFALTVSSAQNLDQIARRVFGYLTRSFRTDLIAMYVPSMDGRLVREYRNQDGRFSMQAATLSGHAVLPLIKGRILRLTDSAPDFRSIYGAARSSLIVPLRSRSQTIGLLSLESTRVDAFSEYDEHLMVVIASHLAGLIEYGRLREEAEGRARNLGLIHEVVQQVIGLTDKMEVAQITADLLAQFFAYEAAGVLLASDAASEPVVGVGGALAQTVKSAFLAPNFPAGTGIAATVFRTGQNVLENASAVPGPQRPLNAGTEGSEMCVALKDGEQVLGLIDVQSSQPNAFTNNDLLAMESLAGVLASVVSSANHYGRLQETIMQLRAAQVESQARLRAQQEAESRLVQAAKLVAVGEMAAGIAHELNNPLTTVTGFAELILDETSADSPHRADIEMVLHEALRARGVVRRLLDFARQGERTRSKCDLNEIIEDVLALTKHFIHTSGVQLETAFYKDLPWVSVDSNQMKQVFLNLVHNAVQAMPTGGSLAIKTELRSREGRSWAAVAIQDSGIGISSADVDRIFEPFYTTRGTRGGTGLGLSVTYGIVTDHGGTIEVESQTGEGSVFTVWLPY